MNGRVIMLVICVLSVLGMDAQSENHKWSIIPRVGINSSIMSNKDDHISFVMGRSYTVEAKRKLGFTADVDVEYRYARHFSTSLGLSYSNEGYTYEGEDLDRSYKYVGVNMLENFYLVKGLALKAGMQFGYLANKPYDLTNSDVHGHKWNIAVPVGVSYEYQQVALDLRYLFGLRDIGGFKTVHNRYKCKTSSLWITIGYRFNLR